MSEQNPTAPEPKEPAPGYQPPATPEPPAVSQPAAPTPPEPGPEASGYQPPSFTPPAAPPPGGYQSPESAEPASGYSAPPSGGYQPPSAGYPEPSGYPPAAGYQQPPGYNTPAGYPSAPVTVGGGTLVDWPKRALGGLVDYVAPAIVISVIASILGSISSNLSSVVNTVLGIGWWLYLGYKSGTTGVTFGRSIAKTKLVSEQTGQPIGVSNGIIRQLAHIIDSIICYIGWLFPLWDSKRQTLADKIMKTVVIDNSADPNASSYDWNLK